MGKCFWRSVIFFGEFNFFLSFPFLFFNETIILAFVYLFHRTKRLFNKSSNSREHSSASWQSRCSTLPMSITYDYQLAPLLNYTERSSGIKRIESIVRSAERIFHLSRRLPVTKSSLEISFGLFFSGNIDK